ncbi:hypothetical protein B0T24DRAFT_679035 [Lasiosphaeria ovina]|uniref:DUF6594 domain-containing protein n=1 Tax=Lasiosphaeria ovina TaxID=92902 RepID=A0AAE0KBU7_9PEZI|nr:hypothetical protein B0T24DRAFT_679035 [Lasiosphaeria ovina]
MTAKATSQKQTTVRDYPVGWPRFAREQNQLLNGSNHRRFGALRQRLLHYDEAMLAILEARLLELDKQDEVNDASQLLSLSPAQINVGGKGVEQTCAKDELMADIHAVESRYCQRLLHERDIDQLPSLSRLAWKNLRANVGRSYMFDQDASRFLLEADDFITTRAERMNHRLEWLVYGHQEPSRWMSAIMKMFFLKESSPRGSTMNSRFDHGRLKVMLTISVVLITIVLLLTPMVLLYLTNIGKGLSVGIVVIFGVSFTSIMASLPDIKLDTVFIGMSAYMAVLVTFLANLQSQGQC